MPATFQPEYGPVMDHEEALCFACAEQRLLLLPDADTALRPPTTGELAAAGIAPTDRILIGRLGERACWAIELPPLPAPPAALRWCPLRAALDTLGAELTAPALRAAQLLQWRRTSRFCGACGGPHEELPGTSARRCPRCERTIFPRLSPAMIVAVTRPGRILLARGRHFRPRLYSLLAGFVEPGESLEACVQREVREEVGLTLADLRYFGSEPWPFPDSLMVGFTAAWAGGEIRVDGAEIEEAHWFGPGELPDLPTRASISRRLIDAWLATQRDP